MKTALISLAALSLSTIAAHADVFGKPTVEYACTRDGAVCQRFSGNPFDGQPVSRNAVAAWEKKEQEKIEAYYRQRDRRHHRDAR